MEHIYPTGAFRDEPDGRDVILEAVMKSVPIPSWEEGYSIGKELFLKHGVRTDVSHQLFGSCVSESTSHYAEYKDIRENKRFTNLSARYLHIWIKARDNMPSEGTSIRWAMKAMVEVGTCRRELLSEPEQQGMRWDEFISPNILTPRMIEDALTYKSVSYGRTDHGKDLDNVRQIIYQNDGAVFGVDGDNAGWFNTETRKTGIPKLPVKKQWGHALLAVGWALIDGKKYIMFKNSWGEEWGSGGYGYLPEEYFTKGTVFALWSLVDLPNTYLDKTKMLKLIKEKGKEKVFAVIGDYRYWIPRDYIFNAHKGKAWGEWESIAELSEEEFKRYKYGGIIPLL